MQGRGPTGVEQQLRETITRQLDVQEASRKAAAEAAQQPAAQQPAPPAQPQERRP